MKKSHLLTLLVLVLVVAAENAALAAELNFTPRATVTERCSDNIYLTKNDKRRRLHHHTDRWLHAGNARSNYRSFALV